MAWHYGTYACEHEGRVQIYGPVKHRDWKAEREFSKICPDCKAKAIEEENKKAAEEAEKQGLPKLSGSEKQVAWATSIRQQFVNSIEKLEEMDDDNFMKIVTDKAKVTRGVNSDGITKEGVYDAIQYILRNETSSRYWIDGRHDPFFKKVIRAYKDAEKADREEAERRLIEETKIEATVMPEDKIAEAAAEISFDESKVSVRFERNENFRRIVKGLRYKWNGSEWERLITRNTGTAEDRSVELGNALLNAGFPIIIYDEEVRRKAVEGDFEPEHTRWIYKIKDEDRFGIKWDKRKEDLYSVARSLPGSRWESPFVTVDVRRYKEVEEFADLYDFRFDRIALEMIDQYIEASEKVDVVNPAGPKEKKYRDGLEDILNSEADILDDLKD